jgi:hypothetical protein
MPQPDRKGSKGFYPPFSPVIRSGVGETKMETPFKPVAIPGGSIIYAPAGSFTEEGTNRVVNYEEKIKVDYMGKVYRIPPDAVKALFEGIRNNGDLKDFLGVKTSIL